MTLTERTLLHAPFSEEDQTQVHEELARVLATPHFANSRRYPALLSYLVDKTLRGHSGELKERTLGINVFHRPADFDTNSDTVVRFTAGEVRKRLAIIYLENASMAPLQIELPVGSYTPEFYRRAAAVQKLPAAGALDPKDEAAVLIARNTRSRRQLRLLPTAVGLSVLVSLLLVAVFLRAGAAPTALDRFWRPVETAGTPILLCPGALVFSPTSDSRVTKASSTSDYPYVSMATADALSALVDRFAKNRTAYLLQPSSSTTLTDLRHHPVVLIGAYNNAWTMRLLGNLRHRFAPEPDDAIYDAANPSKVWRRPATTPYQEADDYALVARLYDKLTGTTIVMLGGIGKNGTEAAAQFLTTPRLMAQISQADAGNWTGRNIEIVLKTQVIDGRTGAPSVEAVYTW